MSGRREIQVCRRCVLPENFPGLSLDADGICSFCAEAPSSSELQHRMAALRAAMGNAIDQGKAKARHYHCIVAFSGGKDSTYTLKLMSERYGLRCLAVTVDNGFLSEGAQRNCRVVTEGLGVDLHIYRPAPRFMNSLYQKSATTPELHTRAAVKRASSICNSCISLINNYMLKLAVALEIPIVAGGYIGGQVPKDAAMLDIDLAVLARTREASVERYVRHFGPEARQYFEAPIYGESGRHITIVNPMLTEPVTEEQVIEEVTALGWQKTTDTGANSTNCLLNDLGIAVHHRKFGFNPYVLEIAEQVRNGLMPRHKGLEKVATIPSTADVSPLARRIGLKLSDGS